MLRGRRHASSQATEQEHCLDSPYEGRLKGRSTKATSDEKSRADREQFPALDQPQQAEERSFPLLATGLELVRLTGTAAAVFREQSGEEQRKLFTMILND
ncbi:MAG: hypothetical protein QM757_07935 [Paludibaculum sp.]